MNNAEDDSIICESCGKKMVFMEDRVFGVWVLTPDGEYENDKFYVCGECADNGRVGMSEINIETPFGKPKI